MTQALEDFVPRTQNQSSGMMPEGGAGCRRRRAPRGPACWWGMRTYGELQKWLMRSLISSRGCVDLLKSSSETGNRDRRSRVVT